MHRKWDRLTNEKKQAALEALITFFADERDEEIGIIAAEKILNFFLQYVGSDLYNQGIIDAKKIVESRFQDCQYDLDDLLDLDQ